MLPNVKASRGSGRAQKTSAAPAVGKAIAIVRFLNGRAQLSAGVSEIAGALTLTKSHCFNILKALELEGWVAFEAGTRRYRLSGQMLNDCSALMVGPQRLATVHAELVALAERTGISCLLTRIERDHGFVVFDKAEVARELVVAVPLGHRFPADAPAQMRARLAWTNDAERNRALREWRPQGYTSTTLVNKKALKQELVDTKMRGYSISRAEYMPGVMTVAAPILDMHGEPVFVLQSPGLEAQMLTRHAEIAAQLLKTVERIRLHLMYERPMSVETPRESL